MFKKKGRPLKLYRPVSYLKSYVRTKFQQNRIKFKHCNNNYTKRYNHNLTKTKDILL